jgi:hypothetical protein
MIRRAYIRKVEDRLERLEDDIEHLRRRMAAPAGEGPNDVMAYPGAGIVLGLSAGISPGPHLALLLSHTVHHGVRGGDPRRGI